MSQQQVVVQRQVRINLSNLDTKDPRCFPAGILLHIFALSSHLRMGALCLPVVFCALPFLLPRCVIGNGSSRQLEGAHTLNVWTTEGVRDGRVRRCVWRTTTMNAVRFQQHRSHETTSLALLRLQKEPRRWSSNSSSRSSCYQIIAWERHVLSEE